jgi:hypothetical protein
MKSEAHQIKMARKKAERENTYRTWSRRAAAVVPRADNPAKAARRKLVRFKGFHFGGIGFAQFHYSRSQAR